ncbi:MAG: lipopolysaccharide biosynthesis protein [Alphaproteobacteria bacterium]|nr:lipopolysaccharide biosynthesis protein [Alphaproteobacteria bacterium]
MSDDSHQIGKSAIWSVLNQTTSQMMALAVFLVTARFISKEDFGTMAIAMLVVEVLRQLTIESIGLSLLARSNPEKKDYNAGFILVLLSSFIAAVLIFLGAAPLADLMVNARLENALHWICLIILTFGASKIHETWLAKNMMFKQLALRSIFSIFIGGGVGIYMAIHGFGLLSLIAQQIVTTLLGAIFLWSVTKWRPGLETSKEHIIKILKYARYISFNNSANLVNAQSDVFLTAYFLGASPAGIYNAAKRLILSANLVMSSSIGQVSMPALSNASQDPEKLRKTYLDFCLFTCLFTAPAFVGLASLSQPFVGVLLGQTWVEVAPILSILCLPAFLFSLGQLSNHLFFSLNKPLFTSVFSALNAITNILLLVAFARFGLEYVALAFALKTLILFPIQLFFAHRLIDVPVLEFLKSLYPAILSSVVMGGFLSLVLPYLSGVSSILQLLILVPVGVVVYYSSLWVFDKQSVFLLLDFVRKSISKKAVS